jgi:hypothetical protein
MRACVWISIAAALSGLGCGGTTDNGALFDPIESASSGAPGSAEAPGASGSAGASTRHPSSSGAGAAAVAAGGATGIAGAFPVGGAGQGSAGSESGTVSQCNEAKNWQTLGSCSYSVRVCSGSISVETNDGVSIACDASGCGGALAELSKRCVTSDPVDVGGASAGGASGSSGGAAETGGTSGSGGNASAGSSTVCDPSDWCCVVQTFTQGCANTLPTMAHECSKFCGVSSAFKAQCATDESAVCVWSEGKECWICH